MLIGALRCESTVLYNEGDLTKWIKLYKTELLYRVDLGLIWPPYEVKKKKLLYIPHWFLYCFKYLELLIIS